MYKEGNHVVDYLADIKHRFPIGFHLIATSDCNLIFPLS
ncbi:hypothetical protein LINPERHAP1_LOCUS30755 [Linum perenne]